MAKTDPPIRTDHTDYIEIDAQKGKWPFVRAMWGIDTESGKRKLALIVDSNSGKQFVGDGSGVAIIVLSEKKAAALRDFLDMTL